MSAVPGDTFRPPIHACREGRRGRLVVAPSVSHHAHAVRELRREQLSLRRPLQLVDALGSSSAVSVQGRVVRKVRPEDPREHWPGVEADVEWRCSQAAVSCRARLAG